jgi:hypothetical protein
MVSPAKSRRFGNPGADKSLWTFDTAARTTVGLDLSAVFRTRVSVQPVIQNILME